MRIFIFNDKIKLLKQVCLLLLVLILFYHPGVCQNTIGLPRIINYDNEDFHAGTQTWDIKQDRNGMMYFANSEGLLTFDGSYWRLYGLPNKTIVRSLYIGKDNVIYVGGQDEFGYYTPNKSGVLVYTSLKPLIPPAQNKFADIWDIEAFGESIFFRATDRIFELNNNNIRVFPSTSEWRFLKKVGSRLIAQDKNEGLLEFEDNGWHPFAQKKPFDQLLVSGIITIGKDSLLISTSRDGLFILHNDSIYPKETVADVALMKSQTYALEAINKKEFVAGTTSRGCLIMNLKGEIVQKITHDEGLQNNNILCLFLDKNQNLWAGLNNGISFIAYNSAIKYIQPNKTNDLSGFSTLIFNDKLYIATSDGVHVVGLSSENADLSFSKGDFKQIKNSSGQVWRVGVVNQQVLMGYNDGAYAIKGQTAYPIMQGTGAWLFAPITAIFPSEYIITGTYIGLRLLQFSNNKFIDKGKIAGIDESFRFLAIDNKNNVWASHPYRGVYRLQLSANMKKYDATLFTKKDGLPSSLGNYVFKIKNRVVFGTEKGVYEFDDETKSFKPSEFLEPVFGKMEVRYMKEDAEGNIWFCSGKQVGVVDFTKTFAGNPFTITYFPELTGQILSGFENIYPYNNNNIFIGSEKGVIHLNYEKYTSTQSDINVLLTEVKSIGERDTLLFGGHYSKNKKTILFNQDKQNIPKLDNGYNSFHFEYSSPAYSLQNNIEYSYQLLGYDKKWSVWSEKTEKDYTNLSGGKYTFQVKVRDNLGNESETIQYTFVIKPAWYNTIWAYFIYIILGILGIYLNDKWQKRKLKMQQQQFEEEQRRLKELHQLKIEKNEKEIIKLQNEKLANEVKFKNLELADATLHLIERTDALSKVKDELQLLYKKTDNKHDVKKTLQLLNDIEKNNSNWDQFASHFNEVNNDFLKKIKTKYPILSKTDLKVCAYLQLNLSTKEIAQLMNISVRGVEIGRYRLRKKLQLSKEQNLNDFLNTIAE